ncbi:hypothetical protein PPERSA_08872 [Pseudocohnilembus persalinus]|uniref:Uncharacterized protein n=1 Tax=Pseudocohnilembus persalinus TaxID=266149 RepID=A0A0V0R3U9_PSEPJ|nr:hypothetical protein PPERSA_08872 [Pseudocohnilembus persalinus]|eukprot:KRX09156.1 hypothetical protein PPERSA_08872 [Pseudocohnilembus persalinus]
MEKIQYQPKKLQLEQQMDFPKKVLHDFQHKYLGSIQMFYLDEIGSLKANQLILGQMFIEALGFNVETYAQESMKNGFKYLSADKDRFIELFEIVTNELNQLNQYEKDFIYKMKYDNFQTKQPIQCYKKLKVSQYAPIKQKQE